MGGLHLGGGGAGLLVRGVQEGRIVVAGFRDEILRGRGADQGRRDRLRGGRDGRHVVRGARRGAAARLAARDTHALEQEFCDVLHDDLRRALLAGRAVHHALAEGAAHREDLLGLAATVCGGAFAGVVEALLDLPEAVVADALVALLLLLPELRAARAAAEGALAGAFEFEDLGAHRADHVARRVVHAVVPPQVAGVVVRDVGVEAGRPEPAAVHEHLEVLRVVHDLVVPAELAVFVPDGVHAVRAGGDDELRADLVEGLDVLLGELEVEVLVARAARAVARAGLLLAEHGVVHARAVEELHEGPRGLLRARVVAGGAAHPVHDVRGGVLVDGGHLEALGPLHALVMADAPGVLGAFHASEGALELRGELALHHDLLAADVDDVEHLLVLHGADLHAGAAGGAGPDGLGADGELQQGARAGLAGLERAGPEHEGALVRGDDVELHALVDLQRGGTEGLAGAARGAHVLAAVALDAGVRVEQARPGEVLDVGGAHLGVLGFEVHLHGGQFAAQAFAPEEVVDGRHEDVDVLRVREVREEREDAAERAPVAEQAPGVRVFLGEEVRDDAAQGLEGVAALLGELGAVAEDAAPDVEEDEARHDDGVAGDVALADLLVQEGLLVEAEVPAGGQQVAADDEGDHADEHEGAQDVREEVVGRAERVRRGDAEANEAFESVDEVDEQVEDEAVEDEAVEGAQDGSFAEGPFLGEGDAQRVREAAGEVVEAGFLVGASAPHPQVQPPEAQQADGAGHEGEEEEHDLVSERKQGPLRGKNLN